MSRYKDTKVYGVDAFNMLKAELQERRKGMNVIEMVSKKLIEEGFDGLFNEAGECACLIGDLSPGSCMTEHCTAGYKTDCDGTCPDGKCDFHIGRNDGRTSI